MSTTSIEWTEHTVNPIRARNKATGKVGHFCEKLSPGCGHCYASTWNEVRLGTGLPFLPVHREAVELFLDESKLTEVLRRKKPTRYFWCNMTDMFYEGHPDEWIDKCFAIMVLTPQHTHQVLTKRPGRMAKYLSMLQANHLRLLGHGFVSQDCELTTLDLMQWPIPNIWLGVSVEDQQRADERIPHLLNTPAAVRFLSCEPLLDQLVLHKYFANCECGEGHGFTMCPNTGGVAQTCNKTGCTQLRSKLSWVIIGGESGAARPCLIESVRGLLRQCRNAGVAAFVKQLGSNCLQRVEPPPIYAEIINQAAAASGLAPPDVFQRLKLRHPKGGDLGEWPEDLRVREFPIGV